MISKITICNLALAQLGQAPITSLDQDDEKARRLKLFYEPVRDEVLRTHNWAFAGAEEPLITLESPEETGGKFLYKYPAEALFVRRVFAPNLRSAPLPFREYFRTDLHCRVLETSIPGAYAAYTRRILDENLFDPAFVKSFSLALACDLAVALTGDSNLASQLLQKYTLSLDESRRSNMTENFTRAADSSAFTEVR